MLKVALLHFCFTDYTLELANGLADLVNLTLIHPQSLSADCQGVLHPNIAVHSFKKPRIRSPLNLWAMREMMQIIRQLQPDILHVQETNDPWYDLTLLFNQMPPLVTTIHDVFPHPGDRQKVPGSEYTKRLAFYRSQQLIVHAEMLKDTLIQRFKITPNRVNVIPHGELGSLYQRRVSGKNKPNREAYTLLFFGRIWPYKGLKYLLDAMPFVMEKIPDVQLIIAGKGEELKEYFPQGYDQKHYEIINDFIPLANVVDLFQRSTATILPYIEASQSGVAALSMGMGTPVIASDIGGLSEVVRHEQDGLLVPPRDVQALADAIIRLLQDSDLQGKMQMAMLKRCQEDLNWSNIAAKTLEVYHKVITG